MSIASNGGSQRVLIMEDDGLLAMHISDTVDELGYEVAGPVRTVQDALALIETERVAVALLDINLGSGETSYPVADRLSRDGVPFAFLTGYGANGLRKAFHDRPVISKPINETKLADILRGLSPIPAGS